MSMTNMDWIWVFRQRHPHLSRKDLNLIIEAYRRLHLTNEERRLDHPFLGLGYRSLYGKSRYFKESYPEREPIKRIIVWWSLTEIGKLLVAELDSILTWSNELNSLLYSTHF